MLRTEELLPYQAKTFSLAVTLLGAGGGPANETQMVNTANAVLYA